MMSDPSDPTAIAKQGKVSKYVWLLVLIPVGLIIGTVTSTCNHIKKDKEEARGKGQQVSQDFDAKSIKQDIEIGYNYPAEDNNRQLRFISSALGIDSYLSTRILKSGQGKVGYIDVEGAEIKKITAVVIELDQQDIIAKSTQVGLSVAVIKSVLGEREYTETLRFIYVPKTKTAAEHTRDIIERGETLTAIYILRSPDGAGDLEGEVRWTSQQSTSSSKAKILTHPALNTGKSKISSQQIELTLKAGKDLREILIRELK